MNGPNFCPKCGTELKLGAAFCPSCGASVGEGPAGPGAAERISGFGDDLKGFAASAASSSLISGAVIGGLITAAFVLGAALAITFFGPISAISILNFYSGSEPALEIEPSGFTGLALNAGFIVLAPFVFNGEETGAARVGALALILIPILGAAFAARRDYGRMVSEPAGRQFLWALGIALSFAAIMLVVSLIWGGSWRPEEIVGDDDSEELGIEPLTVFLLSFLWGAVGALAGTISMMGRFGVDRYQGLPEGIRTPARNLIPSILPSVQAFLAALIALSLIGSGIWMVQVMRDGEGAQGFRSRAAAVLDSLVYTGDLGVRYLALGTAATMNTQGFFEEGSSDDPNYRVRNAVGGPYLTASNGQASPLPIRLNISLFDTDTYIDQNLFNINDKILFRNEGDTTVKIGYDDFIVLDSWEGKQVLNNEGNRFAEDVLDLDYPSPNEFSPDDEEGAEFFEALEFSESELSYNIFSYEDFLGRLYLPFVIILFAIPGLLALYAGYSVAQTRVDRRTGSLVVWGATVGLVWAVLGLAAVTLTENIAFGSVDAESFALNLLAGGAVLGGLGGFLASRSRSIPG